MRKAYHYLYEVGIRSQLACGASMGKYVEWKAGIPLCYLAVTWMMTVVCWIRPAREFFLLNRYTTALFFTIAFIVFHSSLLGSTKDQVRYRSEFLAWPKSRRRVYDSLAAAFFVFTIAVFFWSGYESKKLLYPS